jgi:hypothetical protein
MRILKIAVCFAIVAVLAMVAVMAMIGCNPKPETGNPPAGQTGGSTSQTAGQTSGASRQNPDAEKYVGAERVAKRVVLYKLAAQEGDLAPFTARPEDVQAMNVPEIVKQFSPFWWSVEWPTTSLKPLPISELTLLETDVFPLIASRLDEADDTNGWCLFTFGYSSAEIRPIIADAHVDWSPEERDLYLKGTEPGCVQVWVGRVNDEWKILANITCTSDVTRPELPDSPGTQPISQNSTSQTEPATSE